MEVRNEKGRFEKGHKINLGRVWTQKSRDKSRKTHIGMKRKPFSKEHKIKIGLGNKGKRRTNEFKIYMKKVMTGKLGNKSGNWRGGITPLNRLLRTKSKWKIWREEVFLKDNFTCQNKNCKFCNNKIGILLHPHHIKPLALYPNLAFDVNNGITYCAKFHLKSKLHIGINKKFKIKNV